MNHQTHNKNTLILRPARFLRNNLPMQASGGDFLVAPRKFGESPPKFERAFSGTMAENYLKIAMTTPHRNIPRLFITTLATLFGLFCVLAGGYRLVCGNAIPVGNFPANLSESVASIGAGLAVTLWFGKKALQKLQALRSLRPPCP